MRTRFFKDRKSGRLRKHGVTAGGRWVNFAEDLGAADVGRSQAREEFRKLVDQIEAGPEEALSIAIDALRTVLASSQAALAAAPAEAPVAAYSERKPAMSPARRRELLSATQSGRALLRKEGIQPLPIRQGGDS